MLLNAMLKYSPSIMEEDVGPSSCQMHIAEVLRAESRSSHDVQDLPVHFCNDSFSGVSFLYMAYLHLFYQFPSSRPCPGASCPLSSSPHIPSKVPSACMCFLVHFSCRVSQKVWPCLPLLSYLSPSFTPGHLSS